MKVTDTVVGFLLICFIAVVFSKTPAYLPSKVIQDYPGYTVTDKDYVWIAGNWMTLAKNTVSYDGEKVFHKRTLPVSDLIFQTYAVGDTIK
jgi:hypothetical protein